MLTTVPSSPWLFPEEHIEVVANLHHLGLLKFDNNRNLPLKSGGETDIYINLRNARSNPEALRFVTDLFTIPLQRLNPHRFVEIPDSVSCFAGPLAIQTGIPYITIREEEKEGRVVKGKTIGDCQKGERVCIIDDVITDGASKIVPIKTCDDLRLNLETIVVLVDRQQGWQAVLGNRGNVWPGMTLHDVRRQLIESGLMKRCDAEVEKNNPIIIALDGKDWDQILPLIDKLRTTGCILKVNDLLFEEGMAHLIGDLSVYGRVMVDLKCHDIPQTVENTCRRLAKYKPWAVTVHASGGGDMVRAARKGLGQGGYPETKVLAVTLLTSIDQETCEDIYIRRPEKEVEKLASIAWVNGADGFVSSPEEVQGLRTTYTTATLVTPGVRSPGVATDDQKRVGTPAEAMSNGANHVVMGRQVLGSGDPVAEVQRVLTEELKIVL